MTSMKCFVAFGNFEGSGKGILPGIGGLELSSGLSQEEPDQCGIQGWMPSVQSRAGHHFPGAIGTQFWGRVIRSVFPGVVGGGTKVEKTLTLVIFLPFEAGLYPSSARP